MTELDSYTWAQRPNCYPQTLAHFWFPSSLNHFAIPTPNSPRSILEPEASIETEKVGASPQRSCHGIAAVDTKVSTGDVGGRVRQQEGQGAHEILGLAHLALRDERNPLLPEVRVVVEDLLGAVRCGRRESVRSKAKRAASAAGNMMGSLTEPSACIPARCS